MWRIAVLLFSGLLLCLIGSLFMLRREPSTTSWIVFEGNSTLYRVLPDGSNLVPIVEGTSVRRVNASASTSDIVYVTEGKNVHNLHRTDLIGGTHATVAEHRAIGRTSWSPDGQHLAYVAAIDRKFQLFVDGKQFTESGVFGYLQPTWSPDSKFVLVVAGGQITQFDIESGEYNQLATVSAQIPITPIYSPDGTHIAYVSGETNDLLTVMRANGSHPATIASNVSAGGNLLWTAGDEWIVFAATNRVPKTVDVYRIRPDGSDMQRLTDLPGNVIHPVALSPNNHWIVAEAFENPGSQPLYLIEVNGNVVERIDLPTWSNVHPSWSGTSQMMWHPFGLALVGLLLGIYGSWRS